MTEFVCRVRSVSGYRFSDTASAKFHCPFRGCSADRAEPPPSPSIHSSMPLLTPPCKSASTLSTSRPNANPIDKLHHRPSAREVSPGNFSGAAAMRRWSSFRSHLRGESRVVRVNDWELLTVRNRSRPGSVVEDPVSPLFPEQLGHPPRFSSLGGTWMTAGIQGKL